jgi:hypothetical protein
MGLIRGPRLNELDSSYDAVAIARYEHNSICAIFGEKLSPPTMSF